MGPCRPQGSDCPFRSITIAGRISRRGGEGTGRRRLVPGSLHVAYATERTVGYAPRHRPVLLRAATRTRPRTRTYSWRYRSGPAPRRTLHRGGLTATPAPARARGSRRGVAK